MVKDILFVIICTIGCVGMAAALSRALADDKPQPEYTCKEELVLCHAELDECIASQR